MKLKLVQTVGAIRIYEVLDGDAPAKCRDYLLIAPDGTVVVDKIFGSLGEATEAARTYEALFDAKLPIRRATEAARKVWTGLIAQKRMQEFERDEQDLLDKNEGASSTSHRPP